MGAPLLPILSNLKTINLKTNRFLAGINNPRSWIKEYFIFLGLFLKKSDGI